MNTWALSCTCNYNILENKVKFFHFWYIVQALQFPAKTSKISMHIILMGQFTLLQGTLTKKEKCYLSAKVQMGMGIPKVIFATVLTYKPWSYLISLESKGLGIVFVSSQTLNNTKWCHTLGTDRTLPLPFAAYSETYSKNPNIWK